MINSLMKKIVNLSWNLLNQQSLHLICLSDTDQHSHFTISVHQQCTGRTPKLRCHFNVNKPDSDWQAGPITATTGWHKRRQSNSHLDFQLSNSANDQWAIESWWGTATVQVRGDESGWVQLTMHLDWHDSFWEWGKPSGFAMLCTFVLEGKREGSFWVFISWLFPYLLRYVEY